MPLSNYYDLKEQLLSLPSTSLLLLLPLSTHALLHHHYAFLPATFDPGGTVGPALTGFLWSPSTKPTTAISPTLTSHLPLHPDARHVHDYCYEHIAHYNLFTSADTGWQSSYPNEWFTSHYSTQLPSQWAHRILGQRNPLLLLALSSHVYQSITAVSSVKSKHTLATAPSLEPNRTQQVHDIIPAHFFSKTTIWQTSSASHA